jgi:hypothetical protein
MKRVLYTILILVLLVGAYLAGSWRSQQKTVTDKASGEKPSTAAVGEKPDTDTSSLPPGTVRISPEKQQMIGVRIGEVEKTSGSHTLRTLGRVAVDENRIYRVIIPTDGWVREILGGGSERPVAGLLLQP